MYDTPKSIPEAKAYAPYNSTVLHKLSSLGERCSELKIM
jgi:hypothetical protein